MVFEFNRPTADRTNIISHFGPFSMLLIGINCLFRNINQYFVIICRVEQFLRFYAIIPYFITSTKQGRRSNYIQGTSFQFCIIECPPADTFHRTWNIDVCKVIKQFCSISSNHLSSFFYGQRGNIIIATAEQFIAGILSPILFCWISLKPRCILEWTASYLLEIFRMPSDGCQIGTTGKGTFVKILYGCGNINLRYTAVRKATLWNFGKIARQRKGC